MPTLIPRVTQAGKVVGYSFYCPACKSLHSFTTVGGPPVWIFDGNMHAPSFSPSLRYVTSGCHLYVSSGQIHYCNDSPHELRGKVVPMVNWNTEAWRPMTARDEAIQKWIDAGYSPARAAAAVDALAAKAATPAASSGLEKNLDKLGDAHTGNVVNFATTHRAECGDVGETGEHGDLGSNAKS